MKQDTESLKKLLLEGSLTLLFVRHGQAGGNGTREGLLGAALSKTGERQATLLARRLATLPLSHIYASDMARSFQTAEYVSRFHSGIPFQAMPDMREISPFQVRGFPPPHSVRERAIRREERERVERFARYLRENHHPGQLIAVIGHNGVNGMLMAQLSGTDYRRSVRIVCCHTSVSVMSMAPEIPPVALRLMGCTRHLPPSLVTYSNV